MGGWTARSGDCPTYASFDIDSIYGVLRALWNLRFGQASRGTPRGASGAGRKEDFLRLLPMELPNPV